MATPALSRTAGSRRSAGRSVADGTHSGSTSPACSRDGRRVAQAAGRVLRPTVAKMVFTSGERGVIVRTPHGRRAVERATQVLEIRDYGALAAQGSRSTGDHTTSGNIAPVVTLARRKDQRTTHGERSIDEASSPSLAARRDRSARTAARRLRQLRTTTRPAATRAARRRRRAATRAAVRWRRPGKITGVPGRDRLARSSSRPLGTNSNNPLGTCVLECFDQGVKAYFA